MIIRCKGCGSTWPAQPHRFNVVRPGWCKRCVDERRKKFPIRLSDIPNSLRGGIGIRIRLKI